MKQAYVKRLVWQDPWQFIAFGFGFGLLPGFKPLYAVLIALPIHMAFTTILPKYSFFLLTGLFALGYLSYCNTLKTLQHQRSGVLYVSILGYLLVLSILPFTINWIVLSSLIYGGISALKLRPKMDLKAANSVLTIMFIELVPSIYASILCYLVWLATN